MRGIWGVSLLLLLGGCAAFEEEITPSVLTQGPQDITCSPPERITFDDVMPLGNRFNPIFGNSGLVHRANSGCCAVARCTGARYPAVVDLETCFNEIPEYKRMRVSGLPSDSPDYILLLSRANEIFGNALAQYLQDANLYDTVFARGTLRLREGAKVPGMPDITSELVVRLKRAR
jgi:hypothetical protein